MPAIVTIVALAVVAFSMASADAAPRRAGTYEWSTQHDYRGRPRIRVTPDPRSFKRDCVAWYEQEWRPSGTVVVPRMRCWWTRG
jgi:hypothetical protein